MKHFLLTFLSVLIVTAGFSQPGILTGKVTDEKTGESLVGATIIIQGTTTGTITNLDGYYSLEKIPPGPYNIVISYISYDTQIHTISMEAGKKVSLDVRLEPATLQVDEVTVTGHRKTHTEAAVISVIKTADMIVNGIGADQISKSQDTDAAQAVRRVPGIIISDDRFIIVRGLTERYNSVLINGANAPSFEPNKRAFSFDAVPSGMIGNILIYKSPGPELPADFAGADIDIRTREVADKNELTVSYSFGYTQSTTFKENFQEYTGGRYDFLGFDDGTREFPRELPSTARMKELYLWPDLKTYNARMDSIQTISRAFNNDWGTHDVKPMPDQSFAATLQRRFLAGKISVGNITSLSYKFNSDYTLYHRNDYFNYDAVNGIINQAYDFTDNNYSQKANTGMVHNWNFIFGNNQRISFLNFLNNTGEKRTTQRSGTDEYNSEDRLSTDLRFRQRLIYSGQLKGNHHFNGNKSRFDWLAGYSFTANNDPDDRRYTYTRPVRSAENVPYEYQFDNVTSAYYGGRLTQKLRENDYNLKFDFTQDLFTRLSNNPLQLKAGIFADRKGRSLNSRKVGIVAPRQVSYMVVGNLQAPVQEILNDSNFFYDPINPKRTGFAYKDGTDPTQSYQGDESLNAAYAGMKIPLGNFLDIYGGVRIEDFHRALSQPDTIYSLDTTNIFPSVNLNVKINSKNNIRLSYGKTINKPEIRESSASYYEDFDLNAIVHGNPELKPSYIDNYDIRYEWYPNPGEMISLAAFYKKFKNPIENFLYPSGTTYDYKPFNTGTAENRGLELEVRKQLFFMENVPVMGFMKNLTVVFNTSVVDSKIKTNESFSRDSVRVMQGQAPYIMNLGILYNNGEKGIIVSINYNRIGKYLAFVGTPIHPNTWLLPRNSLDLTLTKSYGNLELKFGAKDLLNDPVHFVQYMTGNDKVEASSTRYVPNRRINLGFAWKF